MLRLLRRLGQWLLNLFEVSQSSNCGEERMRIACLGWGSLVWNPGDLPLSGEWEKDGRHCQLSLRVNWVANRIMLVIADVPEAVTSLWALLKADIRVNQRF